MGGSEGTGVRLKPTGAARRHGMGASELRAPCSGDVGVDGVPLCLLLTPPPPFPLPRVGVMLSAGTHSLLRSRTKGVRCDCDVVLLTSTSCSGFPPWQGGQGGSAPNGSSTCSTVLPLPVQPLTTGTPALPQLGAYGGDPAALHRRGAALSMLREELWSRYIVLEGL